MTKARRDRMNELDLDRIHMTSANGTDLTVGLADDATWEGASSTEDGISLSPTFPPRKFSARPTVSAPTASSTAARSPTPTTAS